MEQLGIILACAAHGIEFDDFIKLSHTVDTIEVEGDVIHRQAAGLAAQAYEAAGKMEKLAYHIYRNLAEHDAPWTAAHVALIRPVYDALAVHGQPKQANTVMKALAALPEYYKSLLMGAVATGGGIGAMQWHLGQQGVEDDDESLRQQAQLEYLNNVTEHIDDSLRQRAIPA